MALKACTGETWTVKEYYDDCVKTAKSFVHLGVERNDSVCILGFNSPEWLMSNMGAIMAASPREHLHDERTGCVRIHHQRFQRESSSWTVKSNWIRFFPSERICPS